MDINEIQARYNNLNRDLRTALATMEKKETVFVIKQQIKELQSICPHKINDMYDFSNDKECPYCGKQFKG